MRTIIVGPAFPLRGGIANLNESLCRAFLDNGIESEIVSFTLQYPEFLFPGKTQFDETGKHPEGIK
ncbi:MAG: glycosyl transferase family 1, partial [Flavobacteriales bacterium]|nr:glycosyl transferase family 1 [Flavobacteriales bacterium]